MKKLALMAVLVALIAAPAMAAEVEIKLAIDPYARLDVDVTSMTVTLTGGATEDGGGIWGRVVCNVATTLAATIVEEPSAIGDWTIRDHPASACPPGETPWAMFVEVKNVPFDHAPLAATKQATVTLTITSP